VSHYICSASHVRPRRVVMGESEKVPFRGVKQLSRCRERLQVERRLHATPIDGFVQINPCFGRRQKSTGNVHVSSVHMTVVPADCGNPMIRIRLRLFLGSTGADAECALSTCSTTTKRRPRYLIAVPFVHVAELDWPFRLAVDRGSQRYTLACEDTDTMSARLAHAYAPTTTRLSSATRMRYPTGLHQRYCRAQTVRLWPCFAPTRTTRWRSHSAAVKLS
jgi:hypothetical protein